MRVRSLYLDIIGLVVGICALLLAVGVIPFTPAAVGLLIFFSLWNFRITWEVGG
jgi:tryptophan-rich sensory protein